MKNFKINTNREPLSDADISAGKDFGKLMQGYQAAKVPLFKTAKFWFGTSAVTITAAVTLFMVYSKVFKADSITSTTPAQTAFINPPMPEADIKRDAYVVNMLNDTTLFYKTGSVIHIPANAFLDANGNVVNGKVELHYREFHDAVDVLLAGIPMTYDSAGQRYHFETAGMMEISATQNGKPLLTNPNAPITVDLVSSDVRDVFNTYYLDTTEKRWEYIAVSNYTGVKLQSNEAKERLNEFDRPIENDEGINMTQGLQEVRNEIAEIEQQKPVEPKKINKDKPRFSIKVDEKEFPEIAIYKGMKFEVVDVTKYDPAKAKIMWDDISLARVEGSLNYIVTFANVHDSYQVVATPVFADKEYAEAKKVYDEKYALFQQKLQERKREEANLKASLAENTKKLNDAIQREIEEQERRQREYEAGLQQSSLVYRTFQVSNFGIYNCDQPQMFPTGGSVIAKYVNKDNGEELQCDASYLVEKGRNLVFTSSYNELNKLRYNPDKQNIVWIITRDMKVAAIKPAQFGEAVKGNRNATLQMEVLNGKFKSSDEVKAYLEI